jgi:hypothetical protein
MFAIPGPARRSVRLPGLVRLLPLLGLAVSLLPAAADEPLRPPHRYTECSPAKTVCLTTDPEDGTTVHRAEAPDRPLWRVTEWFRVAYVSDDGKHLVTGYGGMNLVPIEHPERTTVLTFWHEGEEGKSYTLADLGYERGDLQRTASHFHWGGYRGFDPDGRFRLEMVDGLTILFDVESGERIEEGGESDGGRE